MSVRCSTLDIPTTPHERTAWVRYQLALSNNSFSAIARLIGCSQRAVSQAMRIPSAPQEQAIADALGLSVQLLFPERFDKAGNRLHRTRETPAKGTESRAGRNVQVRGAA